MSEKNNDISKKLPIEKCIQNFQNYILETEFNSSQKTNIDNNLNELLSFGEKGDFSLIYLRAMAYKIFLNQFPIDKSILQWISISFNNRISYLKLKSKYFSSQSDDNIKSEVDEELKNLINLDLSRTFQEISLFKEKNILTMLFNILYIYSKENINKNTYKQGMNEIISILLISIYPYYCLPKKPITRVDIINAINIHNKSSIIEKKISTRSFNKKNNIPQDNNNGLDILYNFFHDENFLEVDLYYLFNDLMEKGIDLFFKEECFQKRCDNIINNKLKLVDLELYNHFINNNLPYQIFLGKWLRTFFDQVTSITNCIKILDIIISKEFIGSKISKDIHYIKKNNIYKFEYLDNICISMIKTYKEELLKKNGEESLIFCLCFPEIKKIDEIIDSANNINNTIKNSNLFKNNNIIEKRHMNSYFKNTPKKRIYYGKFLKSKKLIIKTGSNFYKNKILVKNNTTMNTIHSKNNNTNNITSINLIIEDRDNKSSKSLDKKNDNIKYKENKKVNKNGQNSIFGIFDKINSLSHQFDEYKNNDLIDAYYF